MEFIGIIAGTLSRIFGQVAAPYLKKLLARITGKKESALGKPKYEGAIYSIEEYKKLSRFIGEHEEGIVFLDLTIDENIFQGSTDEPSPYFVAYEECFEKLKEEEQPSVLKCVGTEFSVHISHVFNSCFFYWQRGFFRLRGYFVITGYSGPYQGLMSCSLRGVRHEDIKV